FAQEMPGRGFVMSFTDVTRERIAIHSMLRANVTLEARVTERTEALAEALADAERANSFAQEMPGRGFVMSFTDVTRERIAIHSMLRANV
ncbi:hypothetical protein CNY89_28005, partial [Amaricoccus sp. HAR-UPW-R2A-40]